MNYIKNICNHLLSEREPHHKVQKNKTKTSDRCQNWKPGFNWYCSTVIILKGIVWSNTCNVSTNSSLSYRIIGLSFCIEQYIQCEINTFTQMDIIVVAHLYDTHHKNIQVIVSFFHLLMWSTSKIYRHVFNNTTGSSFQHNSSPPHKGPLIFKYSLYPNVLSCSLKCFLHICNFRLQVQLQQKWQLHLGIKYN